MDGTAWQDGLEARARALNEEARAMTPEEIVAFAIKRAFPGRIALVSSFGVESAMLVDLVAAVDPATPVIFLDTGKHFPETLAYRDALIARLGLSDVRSIAPDPADLAQVDPDGTLHQRDADACCYWRRVAPLEKALAGFYAWITGRKRFQSRSRAKLALFEAAPAGRIKVNPLALLGPAEIAARADARGLPTHPLLARGYRSIGCAPCTRPTLATEDPRAGRWAGLKKDECGIHGGPLERTWP